MPAIWLSEVRIKWPSLLQFSFSEETGLIRSSFLGNSDLSAFSYSVKQNNQWKTE